MPRIPVAVGSSESFSLFFVTHGVTDIQTSAQAAEALRPIAGVFTFALFAAGIIGIGLLAVPVLAASGAYALGEALGSTANRSTPRRSTSQSRCPLSLASGSTSLASIQSGRCSGRR
jgi:Mn2+/Fe2+ NRAMP family transporter